ncbi:hypothetical protein PQG02_36130 (plasmid) [Nostoc sp. UHCC 0926]|uniref:hypothetical protein n=1 Tax=Nostoc sp. UHCC 0926 TaxID=3025190 RepID=UPI00235EA4BA|nr:hypothetical protein [Nostoc sp. UHCC 0926]WDD36563.1 hypothetical protein PQG02_36130 [Nostoc sp. UHCC 0926]
MEISEPKSTHFNLTKLADGSFVLQGLGYGHRANASKLLLITTNLKNQRKNQHFSFDLFSKPKAMPAAGYANAKVFVNKQ